RMYYPRFNPALPSFPTRRSSDLVGRGREEFARLVEARARLHEDRPRDAVRLEQGAQILWAEASADRRELVGQPGVRRASGVPEVDRKSTRLNSSHVSISYAVFCL